MNVQGGIISFIVLVLVGKFIYNWYGEIQKRNRYMETQIKLLAQIAAKQGVDEDKIAEIVVGAEMPKSVYEKLKDRGLK